MYAKKKKQYPLDFQTNRCDEYQIPFSASTSSSIASSKYFCGNNIPSSTFATIFVIALERVNDELKILRCDYLLPAGTYEDSQACWRVSHGFGDNIVLLRHTRSTFCSCMLWLPAADPPPLAFVSFPCPTKKSWLVTGSEQRRSPVLAARRPVVVATVGNVVPAH